MNSKLHSIFQIFLAFASICFIAWLFYKAIIAIIFGILSLESDIAVAVIAASASISVSLMSLVVSKYLESRAAITQEIRAKKIPIYEELISFVMRVVFAQRLGLEPVTEDELMEFMAEFTEKITVWGSDDVIKVWRKFRLSAASGSNTQSILFMYEDILLAIRKDLGHKNSGF
ncbi:MAG: hypothetical protein ACFB0E_07740 [Leptolyngbyaceae cyanobacterium]